MVSLSTVWENGTKKDERQRNKRGVDMVDKAELDAQYEETRLIIEELLEDGSDPDALYAIEHHSLRTTLRC